ncbi:MAG: outer membrane lipoprotein carrier protein LolA [Rhodothermales bacterium]
MTTRHLSILPTAALTVLLGILLSGAFTAPTGAQPLADQVRALYGAETTMAARFVQTISSEFLEMDERYSGRVWIAGDRYRIETGSQTIVSDGERTWIHNHAERQVLINTVEDDMEDFSLTSFLGEFDSAYAIRQEADASLDGTRMHVLGLTPTDAFASFKTVTMWIRPADLAVLRMHVVDLNDVQMTFHLSDVEFNPSLAEDAFSFAIPDGVEVIDLQ